MMVVVPTLTEREQRNPAVVAAVIARHEAARAKLVCYRIG